MELFLRYIYQTEVEMKDKKHYSFFKPEYLQGPYSMAA